MDREGGLHSEGALDEYSGRVRRIEEGGFNG